MLPPCQPKFVQCAREAASELGITEWQRAPLNNGFRHKAMCLALLRVNGHLLCQAPPWNAARAP